MNKVILMGRLTRNPEVRYGQGAEGTAIARYSLAVNRSYKRDGEPEADFINIVAFGNRGEFASKYFKKGRQVVVVGELRINSFTDRDGNKRQSIDVVASEQYIAESKKEEDNQSKSVFPTAPVPPAPQPATQQYSQQSVIHNDWRLLSEDEMEEEDLPF